MNETILAYNLGYRVNKSGELYLSGVPINHIVKHRKKKNGRNLLVFYLSNGKTVYVSKLQAYQKYGDSALKENCLYKAIKEEIDKCVVLCSNCHRKLHYYNLSIEELKDGRF